MLSVEIKNEESIREKITDGFGGNTTQSHLQMGFFQKREIMKLPPSAKFIIYLLKMKGPMNRKSIIKETMMPDRTVGFALKKLLTKNLIKKVDIKDMPNRSGQRRRRRRRRDRRITNYSLVSTVLPFELSGS